MVGKEKKKKKKEKKKADLVHFQDGHGSIGGELDSPVLGGI